MTPARWAVTGGTGLVGRFLVADLLQRGVRVTVLGRRAEPEGTEFRHLSLDRPKDADLSGIDTLVHAAFNHVPGRYRGGEGDDPEAFIRRNQDAALTLFEQAKAAGVRQVVFLSSRAVLGGYPPGTRLTEDLPPWPDTLYGQVKAEVEAGLEAMAGPDFATLSLRATGVYGPGEGHKWVGLFRDYLEGKPIAPRVGTEVHGADLAEAMWLAAGEPGLRMVHVSDLMLDRHAVFTAVNSLIRNDNFPPQPSNPLTVSALECARLHALGWRPGGMRRFLADLPEMIAQARPRDETRILPQ